MFERFVMDDFMKQYQRQYRFITIYSESTHVILHTHIYNYHIIREIHLLRVLQQTRRQAFDFVSP